MKFLSATWSNLLLANYSVDPDRLQEFVPAHTTIDEFDGHVFVSLVAFLFSHTRVLGIPAPFHREFEEVNLRFYVTPDKDRSIRAVTFIKEVVPKPVIPWIANNLFHEHYVSMPMDHGCDQNSHWYSWGKGQSNKFAATVDKELSIPQEGSIGEYITEHYWGYSQGPKHSLEYQVQHPQWKCCETDDYEIAVDFGATYGKKFGFLNSQRPHSVQYAQGSSVSVSFPKRLKSGLR